MENNISQTIAQLSDLYKKWYITRKKSEKSSIETEVIRIINDRYYVPDDIYIEACNGNASGLCQHAFFESDLRKLISILESRL